MRIPKPGYNPGLGARVKRGSMLCITHGHINNTKIQKQCMNIIPGTLHHRFSHCWHMHIRGPLWRLCLTARRKLQQFQIIKCSYSHDHLTMSHNLRKHNAIEREVVSFRSCQPLVCQLALLKSRRYKTFY